MAKISKRLQALRAKVDRNKLYSLDDALALVKADCQCQLTESIDIAVNLVLMHANRIRLSVVRLCAARYR